MHLSSEQQKIVQAPIGPCSIIACAGSGKTLTAVHRLFELRRKLKDNPTRIALLSFTNVAVDTFRDRYDKLAKNESFLFAKRVEIDTLDSFFVRNVLLPFGHLVMGCPRRPFLVNGNEAFIKKFTKKSNISDIQIKLENDKLEFHDRSSKFHSQFNQDTFLKFSKCGAYTHNFARFWIFEVLKNYPHIVEILAKRYQHIIVDEAQDINHIQSLLLEMLISKGVQVSLIGDPMQEIFEFADSNGDYLQKYSQRHDVTHFNLTGNYRSSSIIQTAANRLSRRNDQSLKQSLEKSGLFFTIYPSDSIEVAIENFQKYLSDQHINSNNAIILARSNEILFGKHKRCDGKGATKYFVKAMVARDFERNLNEAYNYVVAAFLVLLKPNGENLHSLLTNRATTDEPNIKLAKHIFWLFLRDKQHGLPVRMDQNDCLKRLKQNLIEHIKSLPPEFTDNFCSKNINCLINKSSLDFQKLYSQISAHDGADIRKSSVHKAKGEGFEAVLYLMKKGQLENWFTTKTTEEKRINYVALTRAKNIFCIAIPSDQCSDYLNLLAEFGFKPLPNSEEVENFELSSY